MGGVRNWFGWRERREGWPQRTNELATPHSTFVKAESTLSLFPFHRFQDASTRYPAREVIDVWQGPIPVGPRSVEEEDRGGVGYGGTGGPGLGGGERR